DRANRDTGRITATNGASLIAINRVPRLCVGDNVDAMLRGRILDHMVAGCHRDTRHGETGTAPRPSVFIIIAGDAQLVFRLDVPRLDIVVADRPVGTDAEAALHLEIGREQSRARSEPVPGRTADAALIVATELVLASLYIVVIEIGRRRLRRPLRTLIRVFAATEASDGLATFGSWASFEKGNLRAGSG